MRKFFSLVAAVLFAGSMMAADAKVVLDFTDAAWGFPADYSNTEATYENGDYSVVFTPGTTGNGLKYLTVSQTDPTSTGIIFGQTNSSITLPAMSFAVSTIRVHYVSAQGGANTKHNIFVGEDAVSTEETGCKVTDTKTYSEFKIAEGKQAANTVYVLKVTSKHNMQVSKVEFFEVVAGAPEEPTFSIPAGVYNAAQSVELACTTEGAEIHYTLDGTDPTAASAEYSAPIAVAVTTTVKAVAIKNGISSNVVSATYTIVELDGEGTQENPFTVADVRKLNNSLSGKHWVMGYIVGCASNGGALADSITNPANIALGDAADQTENCVPVQLTANTDPRTALNLKDNPGNLGAQVKVYGDLQSYFSFFGVKNVTDYEIIGGVTPPTPGTQIEVTMVSGEDGAELQWLDATASDGWWQLVGTNAEYYLSLSNSNTVTTPAGSYDASVMDPAWTWIKTETDSINLCAGGSITVAVDETGKVTIAGTLTGSDGNEYVLNLTYEDPTAKSEVSVEIADAELYEGYASYGLYAVYGKSDDNTYVQLAIWLEGFNGAFTSDDLDNQYVGCMLEDAAGEHAIFSAEGTATAYDNGAYEVNADVLCYNNTLYHVHMVIGDIPEGIEEILATGKAVKAVRDGQVVVLKGDKAFNMNGQIVK